MKKVITMGLLVGMLLISTACGRSNETKNDQSKMDLKDFISSYADDYRVEEEPDGDGETTTVVVEAPDLYHYIEMYGDEEDVELEKIIKAIQEDSNPVMKEYRFQVDTVDGSAVKEAFLDKVSYDILTDAIVGLE